jgi:hypothetical protein
MLGFGEVKGWEVVVAVVVVRVAATAELVVV